MDLSGTVEIVDVSGPGASGDGAPEGDATSGDAAARAAHLVAASGGRVVPSGGQAQARIVVGVDGGHASRHLPSSFDVPPSLDVPHQTGGYALATAAADVPTVVALGRDEAGALYATDTLEAITTDGAVPGATIRDWPAMEVRGVVEGFYGPPWSHQARLDTLTHMGELRMNTYIYAPKDDPYLRADWRKPYPAAELARMQELAATARAAHVDFVVALSPGESICHSSQADYDAAVAVFEQLRSAGITDFYIAFDDLLGDDGLPAEFSCESDQDRFGDDDMLAGLARAQTHFLNRIQREYVEPHGLPDLWTVPTHYTGTRATSYTKAFGARLDSSIRVQWTGRDVVTDNITTRQATRAAKNYGTDSLIIWDNFPANDGENQARLFLGAMPQRSANLDAAAAGIVTNPMLQPYASRLAIAEYASYSWNPAGHDASAVREAAMDRILGAEPEPARQALRAFVDVNAQWEFAAWEPTETWRDIDAFLQAVDDDDDAAIAAKASALRTRLNLLSDAPSSLASLDAGFYADVEPWLQATAAWAEADLAAVDLLVALHEGDEPAARQASARMEAAAARASEVKLAVTDEEGRAVPAEVGEDGMGELVDEARRAWKER